MKHVLDISARGDRDIAMTRSVDAPRELVWRAWTEPALLKQWLGAMPRWTFAVCEIDLRPGGKYRWVWHGPDDFQMGMGGEYLEIVPGERIVCTEKFDQAWYEGDATVTVTFEEKNGVTTIRQTVTYDNKDVRDAVLAGPMKSGVEASYNQLETLLASMAAR